MDLARFTAPYRSKLIRDVYSKWLRKNEKILDIGCGNGLTSLFLSRSLLIDVTYCDIKNYLSVPLKFVQIPDNYKLPFKKNSFDGCTLNDVLHHINKSQQIELVREALRVSSKVLIFEVKRTYLAKIFDILLNKLHYGDLKAPLSFRTAEEWERLFSNSTIKVELKELNRPFWYPFSHIAILLKNNVK